ncbi:MAG: DUF58 domain-containing protein [Gemmataceae bacterium]
MRPTTRREPPPGRSFHVTREGAWWVGVATAMAAIGWYKTIPPLLLLGYAMLALFALNAWLARRQLRGLTATRAAHAPVYAGEPVRVSLRLRNDGPSAATAGVRGSRLDQLFENVPAGGEVERGETRTFAERGVVGGEAPRVWTDFPLGLVRFETPGTPGGELLVLPALGTVDLVGFRRWVRREAGVEGRSRRRAARAAADRADLRGVRDYRPGDGLRDVHWKTTARHGEPFVREYDAAPDPELLLVVDPWLPPTPTPTDAENLEAALSLAASVVRAWCLAAGTRVTVAVAGDEPVRRSSTPSEAAARFLLAPLATLGGSDRPVPPEPIGPAARSARVVVSSRPASPLAAALGRATGRPFAAVSPADAPLWYQVGPR